MRMHFRGTLLVVAICVLSGLGAGCADEDGDSHCSGPGDCPDGRECRQGLCRPVGDADTDADTDADSDADTDADVDTDADTDTDADSDGDTDGDTDTDSDSDSDTDTTVQADVDISANRIYNTVAALAADELLGRLPANPGNETALDMVETLFTELGLTPAGDAAGTTFRQGFGFEIRSSELELGGDVLCEFIEFQFSALGNATAEIVFAGYGMTVPPFDAASYPGCTLDPATGYDDYAGLDVTGKIVLLLRHGPGDDEALYNNWLYPDLPTAFCASNAVWAWPLVAPTLYGISSDFAQGYRALMEPARRR